MSNNIKELEYMKFLLLKKYEEWINLDCIKEQFFTDSCEFQYPKYSNPYYCGIPEDWLEKKIRVMICGEEGAGRWNKDECKQLTYNHIKELQIENLNYVQGNRFYNIDGLKEQEDFTTNWSQFWKRFKQIQYLNEDVSKSNIEELEPKVAVIWNNADKICRYADDNKNVLSNAALNNDERKILHKNNKMDILVEEIKILRPTHIVFLGWHYNSLRINYKREKSFLPNYSKNKDKHSAKYNYPLDIKTMMIDGHQIKIYYLYHPNYGRNYCQEGKNDYNDDIRKVIRNINCDLIK